MAWKFHQIILCAEIMLVPESNDVKITRLVKVQAEDD